MTTAIDPLQLDNDRHGNNTAVAAFELSATAQLAIWYVPFANGHIDLYIRPDGSVAASHFIVHS